MAYEELKHWAESERNGEWLVPEWVLEALSELERLRRAVNVKARQDIDAIYEEARERTELEREAAGGVNRLQRMLSGIVSWPSWLPFPWITDQLLMDPPIPVGIGLTTLDGRRWGVCWDYRRGPDVENVTQAAQALRETLEAFYFWG
jgi:hypothetical protein